MNDILAKISTIIEDMHCSGCAADMHCDFWKRHVEALEKIKNVLTPICNHSLKPGTACGLGKDGRILCPICGLPIRNQLEMI